MNVNVKNCPACGIIPKLGALYCFECAEGIEYLENLENLEREYLNKEHFKTNNECGVCEGVVLDHDELKEADIVAGFPHPLYGCRFPGGKNCYDILLLWARAAIRNTCDAKNDRAGAVRATWEQRNKYSVYDRYSATTWRAEWA